MLSLLAMDYPYSPVLVPLCVLDPAVYLICPRTTGGGLPLIHFSLYSIFGFKIGCWPRFIVWDLTFEATSAQPSVLYWSGIKTSTPDSRISAQLT